MDHIHDHAFKNTKVSLSQILHLVIIVWDNIYKINGSMGRSTDGGVSHLSKQNIHFPTGKFVVAKGMFRASDGNVL